MALASICSGGHLSVQIWTPKLDNRRLIVYQHSVESSQFDCTESFTTDKVFSTQEELITWAREMGRNVGFVVVIRGSEPAIFSRKPRLRLCCERSGRFRESKKNKAQCTDKPTRKGVGTRKCGCPFELLGVKLEKDDEWQVQVVNGVHNHAPAIHFEGHPFAARLSVEEKEVVADMTKSMVKPRNILMTLKNKNEKNVSVMKTIYNARHAYKLIEKAGRSQMQQLMKMLNECSYIEWHRSEESTDVVKELFWTHPTSVDLLHAFPHVLIMDCTYKTNRYRMPLLEIVGVTSTNLTFSVAFVYMEAERQENYTWALQMLKSLMVGVASPSVIVTDRELALMNAVQAVFPSTTNLLCRWHISKNVLANCKKLFELKERWDAFMASWSLLTFSMTEEEYERHLSSMHLDYYSYPKALQYVKETWLDNYKERFVAAWTDKVMHFGNVTTNRAESAHARLKRHLGTSQGDFESSWNVINSLIELQHTDIKASFEASLTVVEHNFRLSLFKELRGLVSRSALHMILMEVERVKNGYIDINTCGCVMRLTHGLPCAYEIAEYIQFGRPVPLSAVHPHWSKLDLTKSAYDDMQQLTLDAEWVIIVKQFDACNIDGKLVLKKKLR